MKTAIFGGTFNPVHLGHINVIQNVLSCEICDRLILMPAHYPPHKVPTDLASGETRLNMLRLAVGGLKNVSVSDYELNSSGKNYTVLTMEHMREIYPSDELYFVMGSDMLLSFFDWYRPERILELCALVCVCRSERDRELCASFVSRVNEAGGRLIILNCEPIEVSSTEIRADLIAYGSSFGKVPAEVEKYIFEKGLYNFDKIKYNRYRQYLGENLSEKRFNHSLNVADEALKLAVLYGCDRDKAYFAGLMHDVCKELPADEQLDMVKRCPYDVTDVELAAPKTHHGIAASVFLRERFGITDEDILKAVRYHTVARGNMSLLEKIVYMADLISAERQYEDVDFYRYSTHKDLNMGLYEAMKFTIKDSIKKHRTIPIHTLNAYNEYTLYRNSLKGLRLT